MEHQHRELPQEGERLEHERAGAVAPGPPQGQLDLSVPADLEAAQGESRPSGVADQGVKAIQFGDLDVGGRVQGEPVGGQAGRI